MVKDFYFTQTSIKDLEKDETCPFRWKSQWLDKIIPFKQSEDLDKGKYFEWLLIGGSAIASDEVTDLPRLNNGAKSVDQVRIESQAERGKRMFDPKDPEFIGLTIVETQVEIKLDSGRKGTIDVVAVDKDGVFWVLDIKLTRDLTSNRTEYGWGNDWRELDLLQQLHYEHLFELTRGKRPKMGLLVFDYSKNKRVEFGEIVISDKKRIEKEIRFQAAEEALDKYDKYGWVKTPNVSECETCPLKCDQRMIGSELVKKIINY